MAHTLDNDQTDIKTSNEFYTYQPIKYLEKMFNKIVVQEALLSSWAPENSLDLTPINRGHFQDSINSHLIHDIFGGEILKSRKKNGWHFYNRIDGERIDFTCYDMNSKLNICYREEIQSTPEEAHGYFEEEDYTAFLMRFISAFEETVGLDKSRFGYTF